MTETQKSFVEKFKLYILYSVTARPPVRHGIPDYILYTRTETLVLSGICQPKSTLIN